MDRDLFAWADWDLAELEAGLGWFGSLLGGPCVQRASGELGVLVPFCHKQH